MEIDVQAPYRWSPEYLPRIQELRSRRSELTTEERKDLEWMIFSHIDYLLHPTKYLPS